MKIEELLEKEKLLIVRSEEEPGFSFDIERMEMALKGPRHVIPQGLTCEQKIEFIRNIGRKL